MNKHLVVLLAICLISVHAFVKRDAPAAAQASTLDSLGADLKNLSDKIQNELSKAFDPEKIKSDFTSMVDKLNEAVKSLSPKEAPKA